MMNAELSLWFRKRLSQRRAYRLSHRDDADRMVTRYAARFAAWAGFSHGRASGEGRPWDGPYEAEDIAVDIASSSSSASRRAALLVRAWLRMVPCYAVLPARDAWRAFSRRCRSLEERGGDVHGLFEELRRDTRAVAWERF